MRKLIPILLIIPAAVAADETVIHRCTQPDGSVAFQELPCAEPQAEDPVAGEPEQVDPEGDFFSFENPFDAPAQPLEQSDVENTELPSKDRAACEKTTRRSIDVIDAKLNQTRSADDRETYLAELLELTAQLRACKKL